MWMTIEMTCKISIDLSENNLWEVPPIPNAIPFNTEKLDIRSNALSSVSSDDFEGLYQLHWLNLAFNILTVFPNLSSIAETLNFINMRSNQLSIIPAQHLDILIKLEELWIKHNHLTSIPDVLGPSHSLNVLSFDWNNFESFPSLKNLGKSVSSLFIRSNSFLKLNAADLMLEKLKQLYAKGNQLETIPVICGTQIEYIELKNNPLVCDKRIAWMLTEGISIEGTCDSPEHLNGRPAGSLSYNDLGISAGECFCVYYT